MKGQYGHVRQSQDMTKKAKYALFENLKMDCLFTKGAFPGIEIYSVREDHLTPSFGSF